MPQTAVEALRAECKAVLSRVPHERLAQLYADIRRLEGQQPRPAGTQPLTLPKTGGLAGVSGSD